MVNDSNPKPVRSFLDIAFSSSNRPHRAELASDRQVLGSDSYEVMLANLVTKSALDRSPAFGNRRQVGEGLRDPEMVWLEQRRESVDSPPNIFKQQIERSGHVGHEPSNEQIAVEKQDTLLPRRQYVVEFEGSTFS